MLRTPWRRIARTINLRVGRLLCLALLPGLAPVYSEEPPAEGSPSADALVQHRIPTPKERNTPLRPVSPSVFAAVPQVLLPELDAETVASGIERYGRSWVGPTRLIPGTAGATVTGHLPGHWSREGQEAVWRVTVRSSGASALRVRFRGFDVEGAVYLRAAGSLVAQVGPLFWSRPRQK